MKISMQNRCHLRFSDEEYTKILNDVKTYGGTIAGLIKTVYFRKNLAPPSMSREDAAKVLAALNRIGNNVNQIARQMNTGFRNGFAPVLEEVSLSLQALKQFTLSYHGHAQD